VGRRFRKLRKLVDRRIYRLDLPLKLLSWALYQVLVFPAVHPNVLALADREFVPVGNCLPPEPAGAVGNDP
jgi:hypothetical protein